jgi:hypothetical protein
MTRTIIATLLFTVSALATAGCGGSSTKTPSSGATQAASTSTGTAPLTRGELIAKADAICYRVNTERASNRIRSNASIATSVPRVAAYEREAFAELSRLVPPASMASDWKQLVAAATALAADTKKVGEYAQAGNLNGAGGSLAASNLDIQKMLAVAHRDGFKDCAQLP